MSGNLVNLECAGLTYMWSLKKSNLDDRGIVKDKLSLFVRLSVWAN